MRVQFTGPVTLDGVTYGRGQHEVPDSASASWFFQGLLESGRAVVLRDAPAAAEPVAKKRGRPRAIDSDDQDADVSL